MRILGVETKYIVPNTGKIRTAPVDYWRVINPLKNLQKITDWQIDIRKGVDDDGRGMEKVWEEIGKNYDIFFSSYFHNPIAYSYLAVLSKKYGLKYVYDLDDNIFSVKPYNPVFDKIKENEREYFIIIKDAPYITTTSGKLKKEIKRFKEGKGVVKIIPNYIDLEVYKPVKHIEDEVITIVYQGGTTHAGDVLFSEFHTAIVYLLGKYDKKIKFQILGFLPSFFDELPNVERIEGKSDFYDWIKLYEEKAPFWDIGVAPLEDDDFNVCKSPIKVMEYGIAGVPVVTSPVGPYLSIVKDGKNGFFARTVKDWIRILEELINNKEKRLSMGEILFNEIKNKWNIKNHINEIKEIFVEINKNSP
jgi:glycosyltransferase involved in cell wall biosynthesis